MTASGKPSSDKSQDLQDYLLQGVSRTFALTIPELPERLCRVVSNNYLLCRIVDTIEDEPALDSAAKRRFCEQFVSVVEGNLDAAVFARMLGQFLSDSTLETERELVAKTADVIAITHSFDVPQRQALVDCIRVMAEGMVEFQELNASHGLDDLPHMDRYCYYVAGIVGETLTRLFSHYSSEIAENKNEMMRLSVSFGQGLQMTNILKDIWDDRSRGACWLPRRVFEQNGYDLDRLAPGQYDEGFGRAMEYLIGVARGHLDDAMRYTLLIPSHETGIRNFCLWAIGMAVLTLRKISRHMDFQDSSEVKISRRSVKVTVLTSRLAAAHDRLLQLIYRLSKANMPTVPAQGV